MESESEFLIKERGDQYFNCSVCGGYPANLIINEISKNIKINHIVRLRVKDLFPEALENDLTFLFEPLEVLNDLGNQADIEFSRFCQAVENRLSYAEHIVWNGNIYFIHSIDDDIVKLRESGLFTERVTALAAALDARRQGKEISAYLDATSIEKLKKLGAGNLSLGIQLACRGIPD